MIGDMIKDTPTAEGFYWATSVARNGRKSIGGDYGQRGGLRWIVRLFRYNDDEVMRVQLFGSDRLREMRDYKDYEGPIGNIHFPVKANTLLAKLSAAGVL